MGSNPTRSATPHGVAAAPRGDAPKEFGRRDDRRVRIPLRPSLEGRRMLVRRARLESEWATRSREFDSLTFRRTWKAKQIGDCIRLEPGRGVTALGSSTLPPSAEDRKGPTHLLLTSSSYLSNLFS